MKKLIIWWHRRRAAHHVAKSTEPDGLFSKGKEWHLSWAEWHVQQMERHEGLSRSLISVYEKMSKKSTMTTMLVLIAVLCNADSFSDLPSDLGPFADLPDAVPANVEVMRLKMSERAREQWVQPEARPVVIVINHLEGYPSRLLEFEMLSEMQLMRYDFEIDQINHPWDGFYQRGSAIW